MHKLSRSYRAARRTELIGATRMEGIATADWANDYAEKSPVRCSSTDVQKEITLSHHTEAVAVRKPAEAGVVKD